MKTKKAKILFIEDDPTQLMMYEAQAKIKGYEVVSAQNKEDALKAVKEKKPDLVFLDILLGKSKGTEILKKIKSNSKTKKIKIVVLTNFQKQGLKNECEKMGIEDFLIKSSFIPKEIVDRIDKYLKK